jgi:hypothetical protein
VYVICGAGGGYVICGGGGSVGGWLRRNGKIDSMLEMVLDWFGRLVVKKRRIGWLVLPVVRVPLHGVVNLPGCMLL